MTPAFQEAQSGSTVLDFDAKTLELVLHFVYSGKEDVVTPDNVPELYYAANFLGIDPLVSLCESYLESGMREDISLVIWQYAKLFEKTHIAEIAKSIALANFKSFDSVSSVGEVSLKTLTDILAEPYLNCSGEEKCKVAWIWLLFQDKVTQEEVNDLIMALVKSKNVDSDHILNISATDSPKTIEVDDVDETLVVERRLLWASATKKQWIQPGHSKTQIICKNTAENESSEWVLILGGSPTAETKLTLFNFKEKKWFFIETNNVDLGHRYAISAIGSLLYVSGGSGQRQKQFLYFDINAKKWIRLQDMPFGREQHKMVTVGNEMYLLGGFSDDNARSQGVFKWRTNTHWKQCGEIFTSVVNATSAVVGTKIFLVGGSLVKGGKPERTPSDLIQCFETSSGYSCRLRLPLPFKAKSHTTGAAAVDSDLYVFHKGKIYQVCVSDGNAKPFHLCTIPDGPTKGFATVAFGDKILMFGGEDENFMGFEHLLQYDPATNKYIKLPVIAPFQMSDFQWTKVMIPASWDLVEA